MGSASRSTWSTCASRARRPRGASSTGLRQLAGRDLDVVVLARGGGSRADLAPFDTDTVARVIAAMPMPVVTGVGHEVDRSVADEVAHTSCKTPTACAQLLVERVRAFVQRLDTASHRVTHRAHAAHRAGPARARRERRGGSSAACRRAARERAIASGTPVGWRSVTSGQRVRGARPRSPGARRASATSTTAPARVRPTARRGHVSVRPRSSSTGAPATVRALDPRRVLERGYSITRDRGRARGAPGRRRSRPVRRCTPRWPTGWS